MYTEKKTRIYFSYFLYYSRLNLYGKLPKIQKITETCPNCKIHVLIHDSFRCFPERLSEMTSVHSLLSNILWGYLFTVAESHFLPFSLIIQQERKTYKEIAIYISMEGTALEKLCDILIEQISPSTVLLNGKKFSGKWYWHIIRTLLRQ